MRLHTYLKFPGNCREAFEFYRSCFGGEFQGLHTFADSPPDMRVSEEHANLVMHVSLPVGSSILMGSDIIDGFGPPTVLGNNFTISIEADNRVVADSIFEKLSDGGSVEMPMQETFWGAYFGELTDRFSVGWQINFDLSKG